MFKKILGFFVFIFLFFTQSAFAVTTKITNFPSSITAGPFTISVSITGASAGTNYLRADLYKNGTQNYFGETYNGSVWYGSSDYKQYFQITIQSGATKSATFQARLGNPKVSDYDGQGNYRLRVRRYTTSGTYTASEASSSAVSISIVSPTPSPSQSPAPIPSDSSSPSPSPSSVDTIVLDTSSSNSTPAPSPTSISINLFDVLKASTSSKSVLPVSTKASSLNPTPSSKETKFLADKGVNISKILIGVGFIIIISSAGIFLKSLKK